MKDLRGNGEHQEYQRRNNPRCTSCSQKIIDTVWWWTDAQVAGSSRGDRAARVVDNTVQQPTWKNAARLSRQCPSWRARSLAGTTWGSSGTWTADGDDRCEFATKNGDGGYF